MMDDVTRPNRRHLWITVIAVIVAACIAGGGIYYWQQQVVSNTKSADRSQLASATDKAASLTKQLRADDAKIKALGQTALVSATPTVDDKTAITNVVTADCEAKTGFTVSNLNIGVLQPPFADVEEGCRNPAYTNDLNPGYELVLKKVGSQWVIITRPTNGIDAATRQNYGIPASIQ